MYTIEIHPHSFAGKRRTLVQVALDTVLHKEVLTAKEIVLNKSLILYFPAPANPLLSVFLSNVI